MHCVLLLHFIYHIVTTYGKIMQHSLKVWWFEILWFGLCVDYTFILDNIWWSDHWCLEQVIEFELWYILLILWSAQDPPLRTTVFTHCRLSLIGRGIWPWHRFAIIKINAFSCAYRKDIIKSTVDSGLLFEKECLRDGNTNIIINFIVGPLDHPNIRLQFG